MISCGPEGSGGEEPPELDPEVELLGPLQDLVEHTARIIRIYTVINIHN